ncbi:MAG TPA: hypothetical protein VGV68_13210, partial [Terriglobia bacterium]|nr:hypothetical protein [Terriglobia bacterium]
MIDRVYQERQNAATYRHAFEGVLIGLPMALGFQRRTLCLWSGSFFRGIACEVALYQTVSSFRAVAGKMAAILILVGLRTA